jgi:hypothetical protein
MTTLDQDFGTTQGYGGGGATASMVQAHRRDGGPPIRGGHTWGVNIREDPSHREENFHREDNQAPATGARGGTTKVTQKSKP